MIQFERMTDKRDGTVLAGFSIRNKAGKLLAIGADNHGSRFLIMSHPRYDHDRDLVAAVERLTGCINNTVEGT